MLLLFIGLGFYKVIELYPNILKYLAIAGSLFIACVAGASLFLVSDSNQVFLTFSLVYFLVCYLSLFAWSLLGNKVTVLLHSESRLKLFNQFMGGLLIATAFFLLYTQLS